MNILVTIPQDDIGKTFLTSLSKKYLQELGNVTYNPHDRNYTKEELKKELQGKDVVICGWGSHMYDEELLAAADNLKILGYAAGSMAKVVDSAIYEKRVTVLGANCVFAESVAESCLCYTMLGLRRIEKYTMMMRNGGWKDSDFYNEGLMRRTIGLVGFGAIAKKFVKFLKPFNVNILVYSGHLTREEANQYGVHIVSLNELFEQSDVVSINEALNDRTFHMVGKEQLTRMKEGTLLINTARGAIINEDELVDVLKSGKINAVLDVFEYEPLDSNSILRKLPNVTTIPHMGGPTIDQRQYCIIKLCEDIVKFNDGYRDLETIIPYEHIKNMTRVVKK